MQLFYLSKQERNGMIGFLTILLAISFVFQSFRKEIVEPVRKKVEVLLNSSSRIQLQEVRGIGPVLSDRIIKYKLKLGGFYKIDQINEIYGIDTCNYDLISSQLKPRFYRCLKAFTIADWIMKMNCKITVNSFVS